MRGGAIWLPGVRGNWQLGEQLNIAQYLNHDEADHQRILQRAANWERPQVVLPESGQFPPDMVPLLGPVHDSSRQADPVQHRPVIVELCLRSGCSPAVQQGWVEFLAAVCQVAAEFHLHEELRTLRREHASHSEVLALIRRLQAGSNLKELTYNIANEGRRLLDVDRLSVVLRSGTKWQLQSASGTERFESRADAVKQLESLAQVTAQWSEPIDYMDSPEAGTNLPTAVGDVLQSHLDITHARRLVAVPIEFRKQNRPGSPAEKSAECRAVFIAEDFGTTSDHHLRSRLVELADLCEPVLEQAVRLDRFPVRASLAWANRWHTLWDTWGFTRLTLVAAAIALAVATMVFVKADFEIEAPATLVPVVEQDIFATASGTVRDIKVQHGDQVTQGDILAVLDDPQLSLDQERVRGEIATVRKRLEAIAVARTDRQTREEPETDRLPLSAEAKQLELRLASLEAQAAIIKRRDAALTLRSPIGGEVLTLDVQQLLRKRPVERGQVLFTVADTNSGWLLKARVPQDQIGHVLAAEDQSEKSLPVRFKLAGDADHVFQGHVSEISETAVLDTEKLAEEMPDIQVDIAVDNESLAAARPGMEAKVRIMCGRKPLGYVWLHDVWDNVYGWLTF